LRVIPLSRHLDAGCGWQRKKLGIHEKGQPEVCEAHRSLAAHAYVGSHVVEAGGDSSVQENVSRAGRQGGI
jgi:hypothetical protein